MNWKKSLLHTIVTGIILIGGLSIASNSQASIDSTGKKLKMAIPTYRNSGYAYQAGLRSSQGIKTQGMWKIYEYNDNGTTVKNFNNAIYCLKMGVGFGSSGGSATEDRTYKVYADMKNPANPTDQSIINAYKQKLPGNQNENYNSLVWILDHCYVPAPSSSPTDTQTADAAAYRKELLQNAGIPEETNINDDLIDIVQQIAIWYFTNDDEYKTEKITNIAAAIKNTTNYQSIDDVFDGGNFDLSDDVETLYNYFITQAQANKNTQPSSNAATNPVHLNAETAKVTQNGEYYIAGPYKIEQLSDKVYTLEGTLTGKDNQKIEYTLLDNHKAVANKTLKELIGQEFYLRVPSNTNIEGATFKITTKVKQNTITYWEVQGSNTNEQPLAEIVPGEKTFEEKTTLNVSVFDLALRKFITEINGEAVSPSRVPEVTASTLTGQSTTATKKHTKDPIQVKPNDVVLYTIRIYNEGQLDGYATEITDYLPEGLELKKESKINQENGWTSDDGKTIVTKKLEDTLIHKFDGNTVHYEDVQIECVVVAQDSTKSQSLKNIAEITDDADEHKEAITDRDSTPHNLQEEEKKDYHPETSEQGKGYEDDDDYEELVLPGKYFDLALRKFITQINDTPVTISREPQEDPTTLKNETTAAKPHTKAPLQVKPNDVVLYTIRIYNEGQLDGYATEITDYLPEGLAFKEDSDINEQNGWTNPSHDGKTMVTNKLANTLINKFNGTTIDYEDVQIECVVVAQDSTVNQNLKNIAEITADTDKDHKDIDDRDSLPKNLSDTEKNSYHPGTSEQGKGYQDDDDYEELVLPGKYFDLALRKFITEINGKSVEPSREPNVTASTLSEQNRTTATKQHTKTPLQVKPGDIVLYTIRVYNEGQLNGYATEITDYLPEGLAFKEDSDINDKNGWTNPSNDGRTIVTDILKDKLIDKFNGTTVDYEDVQIECVVVAKDSIVSQSLKNIAEITADQDEKHQEIDDRDSTPKNLEEGQKNNYHPENSEQGWGYQDDDDYEELVLPAKYFDLALRKFITNIDGKELVKEDGTYTREPSIDLTPLKNGTDTTASYQHPKNPLGVSIGDIVIYTLRIYNEGELDGYASSVTDYLPPQLEFVIDDEEKFNAQYGWIIDESLRKATTTYLARTDIDSEDNLIHAFDGENLDYKELKIKCKVVSTENLDRVITNIAEITEFTDVEGNSITDRDSQKANVVLPSDENLPDYKGNDDNKSVLTDSNYFYKGQQDDDDFEKLILEEFDLALRKFITKVNDTPVTNRVPVFTNVKDENGNYIYEHTKEPIEVSSTDIVEYTLRIYNEGDIAGYAKEIKDDIPEGLEFLPEHETNKEYRWVMLDENGEETDDVTKAVSITTDYLSKEQEKEAGENLIEAFDSTKTSPDYKEVKVAFKVVAFNTYEGIITNIAEISDDSDESGKEVEDKDSTPDNNEEKEDDIDKEHLKLTYFDLALRKFITGVNDKEVTNRVPQFKVTEDGKYMYEHTKEPVEVQNGDIVTYTLRIYNEGTKDGYAKEIKDDLPEGLEFLPEHAINQEYRWVMIDENGEETEDITKAVSIKTDYLSKEQEDATGRNNLLKQFNTETMQEPDYRDIKIAFKVTEPNTSDRILINKAQISDDSDKDGNDVIDQDSTPDKWIEEEDDQDIEKVKVKYFDLALRKWVTEAIVIDNGKETVTQTGHKAEDNPEEVVKVEIKESSLNKVIVKFRYKIRVTNEGEIAGYATEVSDYIPEGLKFVAEDNPAWKEVDGKVVTDQLKDTLLQPGESAEVEILLTWINGKDNFGLKINIAEISKDKNDSNTPDIDSTPNNEKPGEDDIDDAPVILSVKTGAGINAQCITLIAGSLAIIASSVIFIKKYILL